MIAGQVGVAGHISVADGTKVGGQSGITKSVLSENTSIDGTPAFDYKESLRSKAVFKRLPELEKKIKELEQAIAILIKEQDGISS